ncbi:hypothetical protein [Photorhabdus namnaonensis]|uniref:Uncharacterized protein n=1 Tax=Photorhabdus namnaonensis TaxID=1851568 RepID=A0A1B8YG12_9GAMM|nr:hypothetical protein [Photorhabdus namnaonensis]OCA54050.1 hypothetical protein Phpb_02925 [Photorhabdus namnaonensis]
MTKREEFLAYLNEASKIVEQWPDWKKGGLRTYRNLQTSDENKSKDYATDEAENKLA